MDNRCRTIFAPCRSAPPVDGDMADLIPAGQHWGGVLRLPRTSTGSLPHLATLAATARQDKILCERLAVYPDYIFDETGSTRHSNGRDDGSIAMPTRTDN